MSICGAKERFKPMADLDCWICGKQLFDPYPHWESSSGHVRMHLKCQDVLTEVVVAAATGKYMNSRMFALFLVEAANDEVEREAV